MSEQRERMRDEKECIEEMLRDASDDRTDLGTRLSERNDELVGQVEALKQLAQERLTELRVSNTIIDRLTRHIERLTSEAPHPVCALADGRVVLSDGSVYDEVLGQDAIVWGERDPIPRTRRAIAQEISKEDAVTTTRHTPESDDALIKAVADLSYECGEWKPRDEDADDGRTYEAFERKARESEEALRKRLAEARENAGKEGA